MSMKKLSRLFVPLVVLISIFSSCTPYRNILMFQPTDQDTTLKALDTTYRPIIGPNDILDIFVTSTSPEASKYFNYSEQPDNQASMVSGYLVDSKGEIQIPFIGSLRVAGLHTDAARDTIRHRLEKYLVSPSVKLSLRNFRVTVIGEVTHPGMFNVQNERVTLPEALAMAGDLTVFSVRDQVLVIRDSAGYKTYNYVDLYSRELFSSPYFVLHSNDIVYVQPNKKRRFQGENYYRVFPVVFGTITLFLTALQLVNQSK